MHRFYADDRGVTGAAAYLCEEDARHATRVLRMKEGESCELFADGRQRILFVAVCLAMLCIVTGAVVCNLTVVTVQDSENSKTINNEVIAL